MIQEWEEDKKKICRGMQTCYLLLSWKIRLLAHTPTNERDEGVDDLLLNILSMAEMALEEKLALGVIMPGS